MKKQTKKCSKPERPVKDKQRKSVTKIQGQRNRWVEYFEELSNKPVSLNPPDIEEVPTDPPIDNTSGTVGQVRCEKAARPDKIPAETLKLDI
ncbi:unnamed protein product [Schistosoma margrebowiei]|uniref:Uncharacterized protein n=1 Tax=Schistosoma margrebowiei TaxID=48269 RepID=A0A183N1K8_9TREM|nr:unnamed protein product [Schistosoma margrebowiei]